MMVDSNEKNAYEYIKNSMFDQAGAKLNNTN